MNTNRRKQVNPVQLPSLIRWLLVAAFIGLADLFHPLRRGLSVPPPDSQKT